MTYATGQELNDYAKSAKMQNQNGVELPPPEKRKFKSPASNEIKTHIAQMEPHLAQMKVHLAQLARKKRKK